MRSQQKLLLLLPDIIFLALLGDRNIDIALMFLNLFRFQFDKRQQFPCGFAGSFLDHAPQLRRFEFLDMGSQFDVLINFCSHFLFVLFDLGCRGHYIAGEADVLG